MATPIITKLLPKAVRALLKRILFMNSVTVAQAGQDYWVYGEAFNEKKRGYFLDIGAHNGIDISNTYLLESKYNWTGICIEANPTTFLELKKNRRAECVNVCLDRSEGVTDFSLRGELGGIIGLDNKSSEVEASSVVSLKTRTLLSVLSAHHAPSVIDYLSIDVEGAEERILDNFDFTKYMFRCITIERPTESLRTLFKKHEYTLIKEIPGLDCFYVHKYFLNEYHKNIFEFSAKKFLGIRWY